MRDRDFVSPDARQSWESMGAPSVAQLAAAWCRPGASWALIGAAQDHHRRRADATDVSRWYESLPPAASSALREATEADPAFLAAAPGCGGVHLTRGDAGPEPNLREEVLLLAAEAALTTGRALEIALEPRRAVYLPITGVTIECADGAPRPVHVHVGGREATVGFMGTGRVVISSEDLSRCGAESRCRRLQVAHDRVIHGIRLSLGGETVRVGTPPVFLLAPTVTRDQGTVLSRSLEIVATAAPDTALEMSRLITCVSPLEAPAPRAQFSSCTRQLPGIVYAALLEPLEVIGFLCHEYHHFKLFLLQDLMPLMERPQVQLPAPWRPDIRPADGVLHGSYVLFANAQLLSLIFQRYRPTERGRRRLAVWALCAEIGLTLLRRADVGLSRLGDLLVQTMLQLNAPIVKQAREDQDDFVLVVADAIGNHLSAAGTTFATQPWYLAV